MSSCIASLSDPILFVCIVGSWNLKEICSRIGLGGHLWEDLWGFVPLDPQLPTPQIRMVHSTDSTFEKSSKGSHPQNKQDNSASAQQLNYGQILLKKVQGPGQCSQLPYSKGSSGARICSPAFRKSTFCRLGGMCLKATLLKWASVFAMYLQSKQQSWSSIEKCNSHSMYQPSISEHAQRASQRGTLHLYSNRCYQC